MTHRWPASRPAILMQILPISIFIHLPISSSEQVASPHTLRGSYLYALNATPDLFAHAPAAQLSAIGAFRSFLGFGHTVQLGGFDTGDTFEVSTAVGTMSNFWIAFFIM